jgi:hypothetical protein
MKVLLPLTLLLTSLSFSLKAQDTIANPIKVTAIIVDGDTVPFVALPMVTITGVMDPESLKRLQEYYRLRFNVIKMYPYAKLVAIKLKEINDGMAALDSKRDKKKYLKAAEKQLKDDFEETVKNFSQKQGDVLIKLIYRETRRTTYDIVKDMRGSFNVFLWQTAARLFGHNLKDAYDPLSDPQDATIEMIVRQIEAGQVN